MEYMDGGSLDLILKKAVRIPEPVLAKITSNVSLLEHIICDYLGKDSSMLYFFPSGSQRIELPKGEAPNHPQGCKAK